MLLELKLLVLKLFVWGLSMSIVYVGGTIEFSGSGIRTWDDINCVNLRIILKS